MKFKKWEELEWKEQRFVIFLVFLTVFFIAGMVGFAAGHYFYHCDEARCGKLGYQICGNAFRAIGW